MMSQLYCISGPDNDSYMCGSTDRVFKDVIGLPVCSSCGYKIDPFFINPKFRVKRRRYDLSYTYDGYAIASLKFKEAFNRYKLVGAEFLPLQADKDFFFLKPNNIIEFDTERREIESSGFCSACGNYESVVGAHPAILKGFPSTDFAGTNVLFGSRNEKHPLLIVTEHAKSLLLNERLSGLDFEAAIA